MDLDTMIITVFCQIDDALLMILGGTRLRQCRCFPQLSDAKVLAMETIGKYLGLIQDKQVFEYFRHRVTCTAGSKRLWSYVLRFAGFWKSTS